MKHKHWLTVVFGFDPKTMTVKKEILGGLTTFLMMAYILAVNPEVLGGTGMDSQAVFTTTALASLIATLVMAFYAKLPFALAPAMGLNAFFAYTVVMAMGYSWQFALTAVFIEGILFILLTLTGLREKIVDAIPLMLRRAISPGIGFFITSLGITHFQGVASTPPSIAPIACQFDWGGVWSLDMVICVLTFLFIDMFDTIGMMFGVGSRAGLVDEQGNMTRLKQAFMADSIGTTVGALLGTSTISTYVESASGVNAGGRSGLTAFTTAVCFALSLFLSPLFLSIPSQATAAALVLVGVMMMADIRRIDFQDYLSAIPCFVCIIIMPLTYSISDGILLGMITWALIHLLSGHYRSLHVGIVILSILFILKYAFL